MGSQDFLQISNVQRTHLSIITQIQTIKYVMSVPIDVMSTSCSRLNTDDNMPENQTINHLGKTSGNRFTIPEC